MADKQIAVLSTMAAVTRSTDMDDFMRLAGLPSSEVLATLKDLAQDGFVTKTKHGYAIAEKGLLALTALKQLPDDKAFHFYLGIDQPAGASARNIKEFYNVVETVAADSLEFHSERGDFENWAKTSVEDEVFASDLSGLRKENLKGDVLRKQIMLGLLARFGEEVLLRDWDR